MFELFKQYNPVRRLKFVSPSSSGQARRRHEPDWSKRLCSVNI
jgi:hypothetical protein